MPRIRSGRKQRAVVGTVGDTVARLEALLIRRPLDANGERRAQTARKLGLTREGLYK